MAYKPKHRTRRGRREAMPRWWVRFVRECEETAGNAYLALTVATEADLQKFLDSFGRK